MRMRNPIASRKLLTGAIHGVATLAAIALLTSHAASAARLLVVTQPLSAVREAAGLYLQYLDLGADITASYSGVRLPGRALAPASPAPSASGMFALSVADIFPEHRRVGDTGSAALVIGASPDGAWFAPRYAAPGRSLRAVGLHEDVAYDAPPMLLTLDAPVAPNNTADPPRLTAFPSDRRGPDASGQPAASVDLPAPPVDAVRIGRGAETAVLLAASPAFDAAVFLIDMARRDRTALLPLETPRADFTHADQPVELAWEPENRRLFALTAGFHVDGDAVEQVCRIHTLMPEIDNKSWAFTPAGPSTPLPGQPNRDARSLFPEPTGGCWVITRGAAIGYALATHLRDGEVIAQHHLGADGPVHIAVGPDGDLAVAYERRLEVWPNGAPGASTWHSDAAISALAWTDAGLFVGEAGRIHEIDPDAASSLRHLQLQTGRVARIIPTAQRSPIEAPERPRIDAPAAIALRDIGPDRTRRIIPLRGTAETPWRASIEGDGAAHMTVAPTAGVLPGSAEIRLTWPGPDAGDPPVDAWAVFTPRDPITGAPNAPRSCAFIRLFPRPDAPRRILWALEEAAGIRDPADPYGLRELADALAQSPRLYSHTEAPWPQTDSLRRYGIVVLDMDAALRGAVSRSALVDHVANGGAVLLLGASRQMDEIAAGRRTLGAWLSPMGLRVDASALIAGSAETPKDMRLWAPWLQRAWPDGISVTASCEVRADPEHPFDALAAFADPPYPAHDGRPAAFAARRYGQGRVAVLADPSLLTTPRMHDPDVRAFVLALFDWLGTAGLHDDDADGDGLPDAIEDRNADGRWDPGETDLYNPDTDGDGLPDGMEDRNGNSRVDPGETNPVNPDSDGDGVWDGADAAPIPATDAPFIAQIEPDHGPAEGGARAALTGGGFVPDIQVRFGDAPASVVEFVGPQLIIVEVPAAPDLAPGAVDVLVARTDQAPAAELPDAYLYEPCSTVRVALESTPPVSARESGELTARLDTASQAPIALLGFTVIAEPPGLVYWESAAFDETIAPIGSRATWGRLENGGFRITLAPPSGATLPRELIRLRWNARAWPPDGPDEVTLRIESAYVRTRAGVDLPVEGDPVRIVRTPRP